MAVRDVAEKLGGRRVLGRSVSTETQLMQAVREGLPVGSLTAVLSELTLESILPQTVYRIVGSERTLQRKRMLNGRLSFHQSDRLARLARVLVRAEEVLGEASRGRKWMAEANRGLGGVRPIDLLDSDIGTREVERVLGRIEHGVCG